MLTYSFYESDNRVRRYAETLVRRGDHVDVISLRRDGQPKVGIVNNVHVYRVQQRVRDEQNKWSYLYRILKFFFRSAALLTCKHLICRYDLVHVHSVPDFEVFAALVPKISGTRIILDIHDIVPELYCSKFKVNGGAIVHKLLVLAEKASIGFADHTIISNDIWRNKLISRSVSPEDCTSILNYPDSHLFQPRRHQNHNGRMVLLYPGTLNHHQGLDIAIKAFAKIKDAVPLAEFYIYGEGPAKTRLLELVRLHGLQGRVLLKDPVPLDEIVGIMAKTDIGVIPKKNDNFGGEAFSTKTLEFMTLGVPIIVSRTRIDRLYFNDSTVKFFESGNVDDLAAAMLSLIHDKSVRDSIAANGMAFAKQNSWEVKQHIYLNLVDRLCQEFGGKSAR
jgi:glycosyltransferase involved in cell wall biosynthesis